MEHFNEAPRKVKERDITMLTTITDHNTIWCPKSVHIVVTEMGWTFRQLNK